MKRMLINATHMNEELRIAIANGQSLDDLMIELVSRKKVLANVYKAIVTRIEPSLEAVFVNFGQNRHGFLPLKEIARSCYKSSYVDNGRRPSIIDVIEEGQEIIVQVEKEERGNKGAALTTFITLPGCYLVLMPNNPRAGGVSRRIEGDERDELHDVLNVLQVPEGMGLIIRTAGGGRSQEELQWDLEILLRLWEVIQQSAAEGSAPFLIYQEGNAVIRALRDHLRKDIDEILIDHPNVYDDVVNHLKLVRPDFVNRVKLYKDPTPLFTRFQIESQIESAFQRDVRLPSGGSIIIDHTEALVSIDVNSAKSTKGGDIEETALMTNLEAAHEIARQLRLRDIGGLIVIDFIDMTPVRNQREVEDRLRKSLSMDRARVQIGRISRFGLLEMSRQRLRTSLGESSRVTCPRCVGQGTIRGIESLGLSVMRIIEEEALKENTAQVRAILPTEITAYLLNEKRQAIIDIEKRQNVSVIIVPSAQMLTPQYEVERIRTSDMTEGDEQLLSYKLTIKTDAPASTTPTAPSRQQPQSQAQEAAVKGITSDDMIAAPIPIPVQSYASGIASAPKQVGKRSWLSKVFSFLFAKKEETATTNETPKQDRFNRTDSNNADSQRRRTPNRNQHNRNRRDRGRQGNSNYRQNDTRDTRAPRAPRENQPREMDAQNNNRGTFVEPAHNQPVKTNPQSTQTSSQPRHQHDQQQRVQHEPRAQHESHTRTQHEPRAQQEQATQTDSVAPAPQTNQATPAKQHQRRPQHQRRTSPRNDVPNANQNLHQPSESAQPRHDHAPVNTQAPVAPQTPSTPVQQHTAPVIPLQTSHVAQQSSSTHMPAAEQHQAPVHVPAQSHQNAPAQHHTPAASTQSHQHAPAQHQPDATAPQHSSTHRAPVQHVPSSQAPVHHHTPTPQHTPAAASAPITTHQTPVPYQSAQPQTSANADSANATGHPAGNTTPGANAERKPRRRFHHRHRHSRATTGKGEPRKHIEGEDIYNNKDKS